MHIIPALSGIKLSSLSQARGWSGWREDALAGGFIAMVIGFTVATQLPPEAFNYHDDFQKYFAHPVRMLATGTLFGSPLSALGSETLGGQAFLHAIVLAFFPIPFINGADAVFGLLLLMILGADVGRRRLAPLPGALLAPLLIVAVNPQYVNVSALYLGAALIAASVLLTSDEREPDPPPVAGLGLIYGALIALKPLFALFAALHLAATCNVRIIREHSLGPLLWVARIAFASALAVSPWLLLYLPYYENLSVADFSAPAVAVPGARADSFDVFSTRPLYYGATAANYAALIGLALLAGLWGLIGWRRSNCAPVVRNCSGIAAAAAAVLVCYAVLMLALSQRLAGYATSLRYSIPFLLGIVPFITVLAASRAAFKQSRAGVAVPVLALLIVSAGFIPSAIDRARQAISYGSILAFAPLATAKPYLEYNHAVLSASAQSIVRHVQDIIPAGEPFVAWINLPFYLDFARNPVIDAERQGWRLRGPACLLERASYCWNIRGSACDLRETTHRQRAMPVNESAASTCGRSAFSRCSTPRPRRGNCSIAMRISSCSGARRPNENAHRGRITCRRRLLTRDGVEVDMVSASWPGLSRLVPAIHV